MEQPAEIQPAKSPPGLLGGVDAVDKWVSLRVYQIGTKVPRGILRALEHSGDGRFCIPITAGIWLAPILFKFPELRSFILNLFLAFMFDLIFIGIVKTIIRRPRPVYNKGMYVFVAADHWSFPSGHSSRALLIATYFWFYESMWGPLSAEHFVPYIKPYLDQIYPGSGLVLLGVKSLVAPAALYLLTAWAVATATSRILLGRHYVMDVIVGSALGVAEGYLLHHLLHVPQNVSQSFHSWLLEKVGIPSWLLDMLAYYHDSSSTAARDELEK
ncbi:hypothetical protein R1sor_023633 [Riccia sorocarpa]|uniref:Phosphatidic acid phosphatase type 2/haloperoxidase domain-containing protein n=1 Tax=Riccia sorocarpa TaxID=122646 RepID=A0ABD3GR80_9MARC